MSELHSVRKRIQQRRYDEPKKHNGIFKFIYRGIMMVMLVAILTLAFFINEKIGLVEIPADIKNINFGKISEWLPFEQWFSGNDEETVNAAPSYTLLKDNMYANGTNQAVMITDGVVLHVEDNGSEKSSVTIRHDNGVIATYGHMDNVKVLQDERLLKGAVLGVYQEYTSIDFVKNNKKIDMNTAFQQE